MSPVLLFVFFQLFIEQYFHLMPLATRERKLSCGVFPEVCSLFHLHLHLVLVLYVKEMELTISFVKLIS